MINHKGRKDFGLQLIRMPVQLILILLMMLPAPMWSVAKVSVTELVPAVVPDRRTHDL